MRQHKYLWLLAWGVALGISGCSSSGVRDVRHVAPEYDFRDSASTRKRLEYQQNLGLAVDRIRLGSYADAEKYANQALRLNPQSADAYTTLGLIHSRLGQPEKAGEDYRKATDLAPARGDILNNYGAWLCANGYPAEALVWFDRATQDTHYDPVAAVANSGGCALQAGQVERAGRDLRKALDLDPKNAYALESMAKYQYQTGHYLEARAFVERRLAASTATASVLQLAIQIEQKLGDKDAAGRYQQRLIKEFPQVTTANPGANEL